MIITPDNIGFLTYRYGPIMIKLPIGSQGAGVPPPPSVANKRTQLIASTNPGNPMAMESQIVQ